MHGTPVVLCAFLVKPNTWNPLGTCAKHLARAGVSGKKALIEHAVLEHVCQLHTLACELFDLKIIIPHHSAGN